MFGINKIKFELSTHEIILKHHERNIISLQTALKERDKQIAELRYLIHNPPKYKEGQKTKYGICTNIVVKEIVQNSGVFSTEYVFTEYHKTQGSTVTTLIL